MNATELYYYSQARKRLSGHNIGQEIDMFAFYWDNKHTFYRDQTYDFYSYETGLAYDIRCQYLTERDEHLVDGPGHLMMICHFDDYPKEVRTKMSTPGTARLEYGDDFFEIRCFSHSEEDEKSGNPYNCSWLFSFSWLTREHSFDIIKISNSCSLGDLAYVRTERCHNFIQQPVIQ